MQQQKKQRDPREPLEEKPSHLTEGVAEKAEGSQRTIRREA
jgi:hypothetical protein